jgi:hypothetical protein
MSVPGSVGDYSASIGTTGFDYLVLTKNNPLPLSPPPNGALVRDNGVRAIEFRDGLSATLLFGEKHVPRGGEVTFPHDCNLYDGHNSICSTRSAGPGFPIAQAPTDTRVLFGGPHVGICQFAFADGSVRPVRTSIDEYTLGLLSHRSDGQVIPGDY